jgi:IS5 family transposase
MNKNKYRVGNWSSYNKSLVKRGDLTFWFDEKSLKEWKEGSTHKKAGRPKIYSNSAILCVLSLRAVYGLSLRATQGFCQSIIRIMNLDVTCPDYTTLCRRQKGTKVEINPHLHGPIHLVFDSTGLNIFGDGEWQARQHGVSKRRVWRKLHLALDEKTGLILSSTITPNNVADSEAFESLLSKIKTPNKQASGDGAYDCRKVYKQLSAQGALVTIPPRRCAKQTTELSQRNANVHLIKMIGSSRWKFWTDYHRRSIAENAIMRFKTTFGGKLSAHKLEHQATEAYIKCLVLNKMTQLGKPNAFIV